MAEDTKKISRRDFIKLAAAGSIALGASKVIKGRAEGKVAPETLEEPLSRKEHFKPFNKGVAEWQYVEFQYKNEKNERIGVTISFSEITDSLISAKTNQLLVMKHNLNTGKTLTNTYEGARSFEESSSNYTFTNNDNELLAELSYNEAGDNYTLKVHTDEFNSDEIDTEGLILNPQGNLIPVSKDGNFTVANFNGGRILTNYYADHIKVEKQNGTIVGYGRRDSENLEIEGFPPLQLDVDHTWTHISGDLNNGNQVYITAWGSKSGGDFKFAEILVMNPSTNSPEYSIQLNEEDSNFNLKFEQKLSEFETPPGQTKKPEYQMAHGGKVIAEIDNNTLFELEIDGNPGQITDSSKGVFKMVEAHGKLISGTILGQSITNGHSAIWETTDERYSTFLPQILKQE